MMRYRKGIILLILFSFLLLGGMVCFKDRGIPLSRLSVSEEQLTEIMSSRLLSDDPLLESLHFGDIELFPDDTGRWFYSVSSYDSDPVVRASGAKVLFSGDTILAYTGESYRTYELVRTTLPILQISFDKFPKNMKFETDKAAEMTLIDGSSVNSTTKAPVKMHMRGGGTITYDKVGYRMSFTDKPRSLLGMRTDDDWILAAGYNEQDKVRNVFSMQLWADGCADHNRFGLHNTTEFRFVEVLFNDRYWGLYQLGYPLDAKQTDIRPGEYLIKKIYWNDDHEYDFSRSNLSQCYLVKSSDDLAVQDEGIHQLESVYLRLTGENADYEHVADLQNAIDIWLFYLLIQGSDSVAPNGGLHDTHLSLKHADEELMILYTPWDLDKTWGNLLNVYVRFAVKVYALPPENNDYIMELNPVQYLLRRDHDGTMAMIRERWNELRNDAWSDDAVDVLLDGYEADIFGSGAYLREMAAWPEGLYVEDPSDGLNTFRSFVHARFAAMDRFIVEY